MAKPYTTKFYKIVYRMIQIDNEYNKKSRDLFEQYMNEYYSIMDEYIDELKAEDRIEKFERNEKSLQDFIEQGRKLSEETAQKNIEKRANYPGIEMYFEDESTIDDVVDLFMYAETEYTPDCLK